MTERPDKQAHPSEEQLAWLHLKLTPGLGNRSIKKLIDVYGSALKVVSAPPQSLMSVAGIRRTALNALIRQRSSEIARDEWRAITALGACMIPWGHVDYPENLKTIPDYPMVLFAKGALELRDLVAVAIVGSRFASPMGMAFTERLSADLVRAGVTIVSGLAVGIDTAAHRGAIKAGGRTIAVLGCGLDVPYPRPNVALREAIAEQGAVVTELPLKTPPLAGHFPMRNRIISGLALGVVVVEAAHRSGSLITARLALEQGREVFAVPGMARQDRSTGPHRLIRQGAKLVESAEDVLEEIRPLIQTSGFVNDIERQKEERIAEDLNAEEADLFSLLTSEPCHVDSICRQLGWPSSKAVSLLMALELKGLVRQLPGKYFIKHIY